MQTLGDLLPAHPAAGATRSRPLVERIPHVDRNVCRSCTEGSGRWCGLSIERGLQAGDRVLIWAEQPAGMDGDFLGLRRSWHRAVPVDYRFSPDLVERIRHESQPKLIVDDAVAGFDCIAAARFRNLHPFEVTPDDVVEIVYTSGSTGEPKGVVHRHRNICSNLRPFQKEIAKYRVWARPFQPVRILDLLPLSHMFGQSQGLFIPLFLEGSVAFTSDIHPGKVIHFIHDNRISVVVCVPRILENLKNEVERRGIKAARVSGILRTHVAASRDPPLIRMEVLVVRRGWGLCRPRTRRILEGARLRCHSGIRVNGSESRRGRKSPVRYEDGFAGKGR